MDQIALRNATLIGGLLFLVVNGIFTPMLPIHLSFPEQVTSDVFMWRLSLAAVSVFFLLIGSIRLFEINRPAFGWFGRSAFYLTFIGCLMVFAHEWAQVFFVHDFGKFAPEGLIALEDTDQFNLFDLETALALGFFMLGWLCFAFAILRAGVQPRRGPLLLLIGFFLVPILGAAMGALGLGAKAPLIGMAAGNVVVGLGWVLLGLDARSKAH